MTPPPVPPMPGMRGTGPDPRGAGEGRARRWRRFLTFLVFVVLAFVIWLLGKLSHSYTYTLPVPVRVPYDTTAYTPLEPIPRWVRVSVTARGWPLTLMHSDLERGGLTLRAPIHDGWWRVNGPELHGQLQRQLRRLRPQVRVNHVIDSGLAVPFDSIITREVTLVVGCGDKVGDGWAGEVCYRGPSMVLAQMPRTFVLPLATLYPDPALRPDSLTGLLSSTPPAGSRTQALAPEAFLPTYWQERLCPGRSDGRIDFRCLQPPRAMLAGSDRRSASTLRP